MTSKRNKLIEELNQLQGHLMRKVGPPHHQAWMELDLSIGQLKSLFFLNHEGQTNFSKLAAALDVTPPNVTGIIDRLVEHGLVRRTENPEDRRMLLLQLTDEGRDLVTKLRVVSWGHMTEILNQLSMEDLRALVQGMRAVVRAGSILAGEQKVDYS